MNRKHINLERVVVPLFAVDGEARWHPVGTGFIIGGLGSGNALLMTAAHNLVYLQNLERQSYQQESNIPGPFQRKPGSITNFKETKLYACVLSGTVNHLVEVQRSWLNKDMDICVSVINLPENMKNEKSKFCLAMNTNPVRIGDSLSAIGYPFLSAKFVEEPDYEKQIFKVRVGFKPEIRNGTVLEVLNQGVGIHKGPGFILSTPFDSGMSGGPIIEFVDGIPIVRGVISSDMSTDENRMNSGTGIRAFARMIWTSLMIDSQMTIVLEPENRTIEIDNLIDFIKHGIITDKGESLTRFHLSTVDGKRKAGWNG
jgi:hypothetical protein